MKKIVGILVVALFSISVASPALADGAITAAEQSILANLKQGATLGGDTRVPDQGAIAQTENVLKAKDVSDKVAQAVNGQINAARAAVEGSGAKNWASIPDSVKKQVEGHIQAAADLLGIKVAVNLKDGTVTLLDLGATAAGKESGPTNNSGSAKPLYRTDSGVIKQTGANYTASLVVFASLMVASMGALFVGSKYRQA